MPDLERIRNWTQSTGGRVACVAIGVAGVVALAFALRSYFGDSAAASASSGRVFVCAETGKPFSYTLVRGDTVPVTSPHSKKNTGFPAEMCSWTADGQVRSEPIPVLLEEYRGRKEPTFCPDCGRRVVVRNPPAMPGAKAPATKAEFAKQPGRPAAVTERD